MKDELKISVAYTKGDDPFICHVNGKCTIQDLQEIESELQNVISDSHEEGEYFLDCQYFAGQYGEYGRCELEPGWELTIDSYTPIPEDA